MGGLASAPKPKKPKPAPTRDLAAEEAKKQAAAQDEMRRRLQAGRASTILTGSRGLGDTEAISATRLLGG